MKPFTRILIVLGAMALAACSGTNSLDGVEPPAGPNPVGQLQVLHASPDAPAVNVLLDGVEILSGVDYKTASDERFLIAGIHSVQVDAILPGGATATVFGPADVNFAADTITTISAVGPVSIPLDVSVETKPDTESAAAARIFVLHATSGISLGLGEEALPVDVYVDAWSEPNAAVGDSMPFTFSFKETLGPLELAPGDYQIRVTLEGSLDPVYDSGRVSLAAGDDLTLAAVPNVSGGPAAVTLLALGAGGSGDILDVNTPTGLRVGHLSPDTDPVDIVVNGGVYLDDVPYPAVTGIAPLAADTYAVSITTADGGAVAFGPADLTLEAGTWYTVLATDVNANLTVDILADDARPVALYGKVRIYHASPTAQNVDIYVTGPEDDINDIDTPTLPNVPFGANTGYIPLDEGDYKVTVAPAGTKTEAIVAMVPVSAGGVYTAIAIDDPDTGGFAAILLEDVLDVVND